MFFGDGDVLCSATSDEALLEGLGVDIGARHRRRSKEAEREREGTGLCMS